jgi:hypothetical protein
VCGGEGQKGGSPMGFVGRPFWGYIHVVSKEGHVAGGGVPENEGPYFTALTPAWPLSSTFWYTDALSTCTCRATPPPFFGTQMLYLHLLVG